MGHGNDGPIQVPGVPPSRPRKISRFIVMAMLQAARASRLGLPDESAHSWGLNRSIFYAAAKRGFHGTGAPARDGQPVSHTETKDTYWVGEDMGYRDPTSDQVLFTIGGSTQTEADFRKQIAMRFGSDENFERAWKESMRIVSEFDEPTLRSGRRFYSEVYKPRRDDLAGQWTEEYVPSAETR